MQWKIRKKKQPVMGESDAIKWLEEGYDATIDHWVRIHNGYHVTEIPPLARDYRNQFRMTASLGMASVKLDHEQVDAGGRCKECSGTENLIVIE